jgi:hypothetical protein
MSGKEISRPELDERDSKILAKRKAAWNAKAGPRAGDFIKMKDGTLRRLTRDWRTHHDSIAVTFKPCTDPNYCSTFYLRADGSAEHSGINHFPKSKLKDSGGFRDGQFWFFHHDLPATPNGVKVQIQCRVFEEL